MIGFISSVFQSHNGAIAARKVNRPYYSAKRVSIPQWCDCCLLLRARRLGWILCFNPTMVRLLLGCPLRTSGCFLSVSIPQWCDCCADEIHEPKRDDNVSIPQWCDCCHSAHCFFTARRSVSIPQWCDCCQASDLPSHTHTKCFNPTMVRLLLAFLIGLFAAVGCFNPTMVRLLPVWSYRHLQC